MTDDRAILLNEVRYSERLCQRTARYYRRLQSMGTFATVVGGSATLSALTSSVPPWVSLAGAAAFAVFGAALVTIRPADKAAANEADMKRYTRLRAESTGMTVEALRAALDKAREGDAIEVETLRAVAFNDVMHEIGREDKLIPLSGRQRALALIA